MQVVSLQHGRSNGARPSALQKFRRIVQSKTPAWCSFCRPTICRSECLCPFCSRSRQGKLPNAIFYCQQVSPSDGKILHFGRAEGGWIEQVKGITYALQELIGPHQFSSSNRSEGQFWVENHLDTFQMANFHSLHKTSNSVGHENIGGSNLNWFIDGENNLRKAATKQTTANNFQQLSCHREYYKDWVAITQWLRPAFLLDVWSSSARAKPNAPFVLSPYKLGRSVCVCVCVFCWSRLG